MRKVFSERLRELRKEMNFSQKELAELLQTNDSSICDWKNEKSQPDLEISVKIAQIFSVKTDYLLGLKN